MEIEGAFTKLYLSTPLNFLTKLEDFHSHKEKSFNLKQKKQTNLNPHFVDPLHPFHSRSMAQSFNSCVFFPQDPSHPHQFIKASS